MAKNNKRNRRRKNRIARQRRQSKKRFPVLFEQLEARILLAADFGDAPFPYPVTIAENGAQHTVGVLSLGTAPDMETDGTHSDNADADGADEDGVTFGTIQVGALGQSVTVNVQGAAGKLDAWIDFNGDGSWGGEGEQIFASQSVDVGDNDLAFDVPSFAISGQAIARFRLSTAGALGVIGSAADGEVEDYAVAIVPPTTASGVFGARENVNNTADNPHDVYVADIDSDGDLDLLSASRDDKQFAWYENDGNQEYVQHTISERTDAFAVYAADMDGDGDLDVLGASFLDNQIAWFENDGSQNFTAHTISDVISFASDVLATDLDGDGDTDVLGVAFNGGEVVWYENDGNQNFVAHSIGVHGTREIDVADVDGDGDLDVLIASVRE
jgi:hypothetical protein